MLNYQALHLLLHPHPSPPLGEVDLKTCFPQRGYVKRKIVTLELRIRIVEMNQNLGEKMEV